MLNLRLTAHAMYPSESTLYSLKLFIEEMFNLQRFINVFKSSMFHPDPGS